MRTVIETPIFVKRMQAVWTEDQRESFVAWIAMHPLAGSVIPGSGGLRKVRWSASGRGKRGGARVIYFIPDDATIVLLMVYTKAKHDDLPLEFLAMLKRGVNGGS